MELGALLGELRAADGDVLGAFEARIQERATPVQRASRQACLELHTTPSPST